MPCLIVYSQISKEISIDSGRLRYTSGVSTSALPPPLGVPEMYQLTWVFCFKFFLYIFDCEFSHLSIGILILRVLSVRVTLSNGGEVPDPHLGIGFLDISGVIKESQALTTQCVEAVILWCEGSGSYLVGVTLALQFVLSPLGFDELGVDLLLQLVQLSGRPAHLALLGLSSKHERSEERAEPPSHFIGKSHTISKQNCNALQCLAAFPITRNGKLSLCFADQIFIFISLLFIIN